MSVFNCNVKFKKINGDSELSSKNKMVANGFIDKYYNILDLDSFRRANNELSNEVSKFLGREVILYFEENGDKKAIPNKEVFQDIDYKKRLQSVKFDGKKDYTIDNLGNNIGENDELKPFVDESKKIADEIRVVEQQVQETTIKPGVEELFEQNSELASIGTPEQYSQYLDATQNKFISSNDKVVFGHPTIGKSFLKNQGEDKFITLDDDYANEVNAFVDANRGSETRQEYKGRKPKEYNEFMLDLYDRLKLKAQREGKILFVSNTNILKERMSDFDRVITIPKEEFKKRFDARGATYGFEDWKSDIDATIAKVPTNKVITTTGYLADLFRGSKQDLEGFKEFVRNSQQGKQMTLFNISDDVLEKPQSNLSNKAEQLAQLPDNKWFRKVIQPVINRFSKMFPNIRVNVISMNEIPKEVQAKINDLGKQINSFYHKGQVYIIKERVSKDITIEEFLHPFINALEKDNPELFKSLLKEAKQLFPELKERVFIEYDKVYDSIFDKNREFLTQVLTQKVSELLPEQQTWFDKFKNWLKSILDKMFGSDFVERDISQLDEKMSLTELASVLAENNTSFDIKGDEMTYYSLSTEEVDFYLNAPSEPLQKEILLKVLENNKLVEFEEDSHQYFINPDGEKKELIPVSNVIFKPKFENKYEGFLEMGNLIHDLVKRINLGESFSMDEILKDSKLKDFLVDEKGYPENTIKTIYQNVYNYINYLKSNGSVLISEVSVHSLSKNFGEQYAGIAGTIDLLEIKKDGSITIHDFKTMFIDYKKVFETSPATLTKNKFELKKQVFGEQLSLYSKILKGILNVTDIELQIVPISYLAETIKEGDVISFKSPENLEIKERPEIINGIFNPIKVVATAKDIFGVKYNKKFADKILPEIIEKEEEKVKTREQIDREKVLSVLTTKMQQDNSKEFEKQLENTFKAVVDIYKKYGSSKDELNKRLYEIFDQNGLFAKTKIDWESLYKRLNEMTEDDPQRVKFYLSTLVQYMNYIDEMTLGVRNIRSNFTKIISEKDKMSNQELLTLMKKSYDLAQYNKSYITETLSQLSEIEEDNLMVKQLTYALKDIEQIENEYFKRSLPIISEILNSYFPQEAKERMIEEYSKRLAQKKYNADKSTGSAREGYLKEAEQLQKMIDMLPSPNIIARVIQGEFGDADWFFSNLFANINNDDYIIAGTEVYMSRIMKDLQDIAIIKQEETGRIFEEYKNAVGVSIDNPKKLNEDLVYEVKKLVRKKDGTFDTELELTLLTDVDQNIYYEEDLLRYKIETSTGDELIKARKELATFIKENYESKYSKTYLDILDSLDVVLSDGRTVKDIYQEKLRAIQDIQIQHNRKDYNEGNLPDEVYIEMREAWRDYNNLYSSVDREGNKKTGDELKVAEVLGERRNQLNKFRTKKYDVKAWEANRAKKIAELLTKYKNEKEVLESDEFKKWQSINSIISPSEEYYKERANLLEKINNILDKREYKEEATAKNLKLSLNQYWEQMISMVKEYRDYEREIQTADMSDEVKDQLKLLEEMIDVTNNQIKLLQEKMSRADAKELSDLYEQYNSMVEYKTSKYYEDDFQRALAEFALAKDLSVTEIQNNEELMTEFKSNSEWYKKSHVNKYKYNPVLGETVLSTEPAYYYKVIIPTNPDYIKELPAAQYSSYELIPEALNPNYLDQFGRPNVKSTSKYVVENFKYLKLKNATDNKGKAKYAALKHLRQRAEEAQLGLDSHNYIYYAIPSRQKTISERVLGDGGKGLWTNLKNKVVKTAEDEEIFGTRAILTTMVGEQAKFIPVRGKFKIDINDQSYNIWGASLDFYLSAEKSKLFTKHLPTMEVLVDQLKKSENQPNEEGLIDSLGKSIKNNLGLKNVSDTVKGKTNLRLRNVEDIINRHFYDEWQKELITVFGMSDVKLTNTLLGAAGSNMMMLNIPNWFVNFASGNIQMMIESAGARYFSKKDYASAKKEFFLKLKKDMILDISKTHNKSLIGQMMDYYDPMKGEYIDSYGKKFTWSKRTNLRDVLFFGKNLGEFEMQMTTFIAMLKSKKVKQILPSGQENIISLYDAYEKGDDGIPKLKEGVQFTKEQEREYMLKIHGINKQLNGAYSKMDQSYVENYSIGRLLFFMKKFFLPLWANRYFKIRGDWEVGDVREGHYYAFYDTIMKDVYRLKGNLPEILSKWKLSPEEGGYTDLQKQAITKTATELVFIAAMFMALALLGYDDGEDDTDSEKYGQYFFLKLRKEIATFTPVLAPQEFIGIFSRPIAAASYIGNTANLVETGIKTAIYYPTGFFEDDVLYQKKTALFEKGDSKFLALAYKFAGLKVNVLEPQQLLQGYNYSIRY